jgi:glycosyltransferase involved in cell wall biosynthesis
MKVDVVVCAKNSAETLRPVLERVLRYVPVNRLIVIDGESDDGTVKIAEEFGAEIHSDGGKGLGYARNMALSLVETPIFAFIDADTLIPKNWFSLIRHFKDPKVAVANGYTFFGRNNPVLKALSDYQLRSDRLEPPSFSNTLVSVRSVVDVGGIREDLPSCEDSELHERLSKNGFRWVVDKRIVAHHPRSLSEHLSHVKWWGRGSRATRKPISFHAWYLMKSPASGLKLALKANPALLIYYPLLRLSIYMGYLEETKMEKRKCGRPL